MVTLTCRVAAFTAVTSVLVWGRPVMAQPRATLSPPMLDLGAVLQGTRIDATFRVRNDGSAPLVLRRADMTPPLVAAKLPAVIPPGSEVTLVFALDTTRLRGSFEGALALTTDPEVSGLEATVACTVVRPVEAYPPVLFIVGQRGEGREATVEIVNHGDAPLQLLAIDHASQRLTARADVLEDGRRFRVTVRLRPDGPGGRQTETLSLRTSSASMPTLGLVVNSHLRERVYTFPEAVDLGTLQWQDIERSPELLDRTAQTLMVYQVGGRDFAASFSSDGPARRTQRHMNGTTTPGRVWPITRPGA